MITRDFIGELHCPYCGSGLVCEAVIGGETDGAIRNAILRCACYRYPLIDGIAVLRQRSGPTDAHDSGVAFLERGDAEGALADALHSTPVPRKRSLLKRVSGRAARALSGRQRPPVADGGARTFYEALRSLRPDGYADYLFHRFANNSFIAALPLLLLVRELAGKPFRVLDLNCGVGHASFLIQTVFPDASAVVTDHDFVNLYLARRYVVPERTICLCLDAEAPLPFRDRSFDALLCMDGLHYIRSKRALVRELDRIAEPLSLWLFPHMHNALAANVCPGIAMDAQGYAKNFDFLPFRILNEATILDRFMRERTMDLEASSPSDELQTATAFSVVASRRPDLWRQHHDLWPYLLRAGSKFQLNPIYRETTAGGVVRLDMSWPNPNLQAECNPVTKYLPQIREVDATQWARLRQLAPENNPDMEDLINSLILVPLPEKYA